MDYINKELLQKYFYYGIEGKQELESGILYYVTSKIHREVDIYSMQKAVNDVENKDRLEYHRNVREEQQEQDEKMKLLHMERLIEEASKIYKQYYRFIVLPDKKENYNMDITSEEMQQISSSIQNKINILQQEGKLNIYPVGIYFTQSQEEIYTEKTILEDITTYRTRHYKNWTQDVYEILVELEKLEKGNAKKYQEEWINVRLARANNRNPKDEIEVSNIKKLKEIFEKKKEEYKEEEKER